jgi:hypothetical protein
MDEKKLIEELLNLVKKYPNDSELGKKVRSFLIQIGVYE